MYLIAKYYKPHTDRGDNGHERCAYDLRLAEDRSEAEDTLISLALNDASVVQDGYILTDNSGIKLWESGDYDFEGRDYSIEIKDWKGFQKTNVHPDKRHSSLGAITESELRDLIEAQH